MIEIETEKKIAILAIGFSDKKILDVATAVVYELESFESSWQRLSLAVYRYKQLTGFKDKDIATKILEVTGKKPTKGWMSKLLTCGSAIEKNPDLLKLHSVEVVYRIAKKQKKMRDPLSREEIENDTKANPSGGAELNKKAIEKWLKATRTKVLPALNRPETKTKLEALLKEIEDEIQPLALVKKFPIGNFPEK